MLFHSIISDTFYLNLFFTLLLGLLSIYIYDKCKYKFIGILSGILLALIAQFSNCDYGAYGVAIILIFYIFKNNIFNSCIFFIFATLIKYCIPCIKYGGFPKEYLYLFIGTIIPSLFFATWNSFNFEINYSAKFIPLATTSFIISISSSISFGVTIRLNSFGIRASFIIPYLSSSFNLFK